MVTQTNIFVISPKDNNNNSLINNLISLDMEYQLRQKIENELNGFHEILHTDGVIYTLIKVYF